MSKVSAVTVLSPYLKDDIAAFVEITNKIYFLLSPIEVIDRYTISFFIKSDKEQSITVQYGESYKNFQINTEWLKISWSFKAEWKDNLVIRLDKGNYYIYNTKLERGSVATDYNKSLDDSQKEITEIETISLQRYNEVVQSLDEYKIEVGKTYTTKTEHDETKARVQLNADQLYLMVESSDDKSQITLTDKMIKAITTQFVVTNEDGTSTIIEGGTINLEQLFAQDITATGTIRGINLITNSGELAGWLLREGYGLQSYATPSDGFRRVYTISPPIDNEFVPLSSFANITKDNASGERVTIFNINGNGDIETLGQLTVGGINILNKLAELEAKLS